MATVRQPKDQRDLPASGAKDVAAQVATLKELIADLLRSRSLRDPLADLHPDLTGPQVHAIVALGLDGALPTSVLSQRVGASVPATTGLVDRMEKSGLVERDKDPSDRRIVLVRLTAAGQEVFATLEKDSTEKLTLLLGALDAHDVDTLLGVLRRILDVMRLGHHLAGHGATVEPAGGDDTR